MLTLTYPLLMASSRDAGNRSMRKAGRTCWNRDDWNAAAEVAERLIPHLDPLIESQTTTTKGE